MKVAAITAMVRIPGRPAALRVYTADEEGVAREYADKEGGEYVPLPTQDQAWDWSKSQPGILQPGNRNVLPANDSAAA